MSCGSALELAGSTLRPGTLVKARNCIARKRRATARLGFDLNLPRRPQLAERAAAGARETGSCSHGATCGGDDGGKENDPRWRQRRLKLLPKWRIGVHFFAESRRGWRCFCARLARAGGRRRGSVHPSTRCWCLSGATALTTQRRAVSKSAHARCGTELSERALVADTTWHSIWRGMLWRPPFGSTMREGYDVCSACRLTLRFHPWTRETCRCCLEECITGDTARTLPLPALLLRAIDRLCPEQSAPHCSARGAVCCACQLRGSAPGSARPRRDMRSAHRARSPPAMHRPLAAHQCPLPAVQDAGAHATEQHPCGTYGACTA